jgi:hypothetical protein
VSHQVADAHYRDLARALSGPADRNALEAAFTGADGRACLSVVKVLAWMHRQDGTARPFVGSMAPMLKGKQGDALAHWELARAYAVSLTNGDPPRRTDALGHLKLAMAAAQSDDMRMHCIRELASACRAGHLYSTPLQVLASMAATVNPAQQVELRQLGQQLQDEATAWKRDHVSTAPASLSLPTWVLRPDRPRLHPDPDYVQE